MEEKYEFIDTRVISMNFEERIFSKKIDEYNLSVEIETTVMASADKNDNKYLVRLKFDIKDENNDFIFNIEFINRVYLAVNNNDDLNILIKEDCIPDLLRRARKRIKDITTNMKIKPLELPPFDEEMN